MAKTLLEMWLYKYICASMHVHIQTGMYIVCNTICTYINVYIHTHTCKNVVMLSSMLL